jgi:hypothetical protein
MDLKVHSDNRKMDILNAIAEGLFKQLKHLSLAHYTGQES